MLYFVVNLRRGGINVVKREFLKQEAKFKRNKVVDHKTEVAGRNTIEQIARV